MGVLRLTDDLDMNGHHLRDWRYLEDIPSGGATTGQALVWSGTVWQPGTVATTGTAVVTWGDVTDKPATFPPETHVHTIADVTDWLTETLAVSALEVENTLTVNTTLAVSGDTTPVGLTILDSAGDPHVMGWGAASFVTDNNLRVNPGSGSGELRVGATTGKVYIGARVVESVIGSNYYNGLLLADVGIDITGAYGIRTGGNARFGGTLQVNGTGDFNGLVSANGGLKTDTIVEETAAAGVTIDSVLLKDETVTADQIIVSETSLGGKVNYKSKLAIANSGFGELGTTYKLYASTVTINAAAGSFATQAVRIFDSEIALTNGTPGLFSGSVHVIRSTFNASTLSITSSPVSFTFTNPASGQGFANGYLSVDMKGTSGEVVAAYTRARVTGTANGIGYKGYAVGDAAGASGAIIGVQGYAVNAHTQSEVVGVDSIIFNTGGAGTPVNKRVGLRSRAHLHVTGGSIFCVTGTGTTPSAVTPGHVRAGTDTGQLFVQGVAEFDKEVYMDGNTSLSITATSSDYTAGVKSCIFVDASAAKRTITLPAASGKSGRTYWIKKVDSSANTVVVDGNSAETIDGAATYDLPAQYDAVHLVCNGSNWWIV